MSVFWVVDSSSTSCLKVIIEAAREYSPEIMCRYRSFTGSGCAWRTRMYVNVMKRASNQRVKYVNNFLVLVMGIEIELDDLCRIFSKLGGVWSSLLGLGA